jgi:glutamine amidotransferase
LKTVAVIDYGAGNLRSVVRAIGAVAGAEIRASVTSDPGLVAAADAIVLPGVGAFADCRHGLASRPGLIEAMSEAALERARPFLGICVGMQLMASLGVEFGETPGLDWIAGRVEPLSPSERSLRIPQIGWNDLQIWAKGHPVFSGLKDGDHAYFVHSFAFCARHPSQVLASVDYGGEVTAAIGRDNLVGVQFHPEKSQRVGLLLIENFLGWRP